MYKSMGLIGGHAYSVIAAHEGDDFQILKVRNPWGEHEWNGDWSDKSPLWTDELREELNYVDADDGSFWMSVDDFKNCFIEFYLCKYRDDFEFSNIKIEADE